MLRRNAESVTVKNVSSDIENHSLSYVFDRLLIIYRSWVDVVRMGSSVSSEMAAKCSAKY